MVATVAELIPAESANDLPMIRQVINDMADAYRKDGWAVSDFAQDSIVRAVQRQVRANFNR